MPIQPLFINSFQTGSDENANIGFGAMLNVENYTVKGVARLTKASTKKSASVVTDLPIYFTSQTPTAIFAQGSTGKVYSSSDNGSTWTDISNASSSGAGEGLMFYNNYLFAFRAGKIDYCASPYGSANWTTAWQSGLSISGNFPFIFPNDGSMYFANGNSVGKIGFGTASTFNPGGSADTDYFYTATQLTLPNIYQVNCMSFLPSNYIALGTASSGLGNNAQQIADVILWNPTLSTYETPLRLFTQAGTGGGGVNQIINRNNVLYAVTGGNHAIFATNGSTFNMVADISLRTTGRYITNNTYGAGTGNTNGIQATAPIFLNQHPSAIGVMGNKIFTGVSSSIGSLPSGYGLFPLGVYSVAFTEEGYGSASTAGKATQIEFTVSSGVICGNTFDIGAVYPLAQAQMLIGWYDGTNYGIDKTEYQNFVSDPSVVWLESELFEIGTPLEPAVITTIQENIVRNLITSQNISVYWRTGFDQAYTLLETYNAGDGNAQLNNSLKSVYNAVGTVKFLQLKVTMNTGGSNLPWSPEIRNIIVK